MNNLTKYFSIIIFTISIQSFSQEKAFEELDSYLSDYRQFDFEQFIRHDFENFEIEDNHFNGGYLTTRERDWKITESIYHFEINYWIEKSSRYRFLNLHTFSQNGEIFLVIYHNDSFSERVLEPKYFGRIEKLKSVLNAHNNFYHSDFSIEDMISQLSEGEVYGYACGDAPIIEKIPSIKGYKFNQKSNLEIFRNWLQSFNLEMQTYGVDAIGYLVRNKGLKLSIEDQKIINHIKERNSILNTCSGCLEGLYKKAFKE